ncbi:MAG: hypothetical protein JST16_04860 [Bdellovibrionales bacterium]|nr:hypothetical protein [Bdellovibrionales bacterium]
MRNCLHTLTRPCILALGAVVAMSAQAGHYERLNFRDIRWLGRGNTGVATINDGTALFYNPAGLGQQESYSFSIFNPVLGGDENLYTSVSQLSNVTRGSTTLSEKFSPFLGKSLGLQGSIFPHIALPGFAGGFWDTFDSSILYQNPVNPHLDLDARNDYGLIFGTGFGYQKFFTVGASLRYQKRKSLQQDLTVDSLITTKASDLENVFRTGEGWGLNVGAQSRIPLGKIQWVGLGVTVEDVGNTRFRSSTGIEPLAQGQQVNAGLAYGMSSALIDFTMLADVRQLNETSMSTGKKVYLGTEVSLLKMDLRAGMFQGYWTVGASLRILPLFDIDFATYGEEMASFAGIKENRTWMIGLRTGIGLKMGKGGKKSKRYRSQLDAL